MLWGLPYRVWELWCVLVLAIGAGCLGRLDLGTGRPPTAG
jgi:hypothetical protein